MAGRFSVDAVFRAVDRVTKPVSRMQRRVQKFTRSMNRNFRNLNNQIGKFGAGARKAGLAVAAGLAIGSAAMASVITTGAQFEQTLVSAAAKFPGEVRRGTVAFEELEAAARRTGATTEFTATQSAQALNFLAMAGFSAGASVAALPGVVDLATAASVDLGTATDIASDTLGAFGLMTQNTAQLTKNLARVNDVLARTTTSANTTTELFFETIRQGGPVATAAGASIETFAALTGELANAGIKGAKAGTTLKNVFLALAAPGGAAAATLRKLGVQTSDSQGNLLDVIDVLGSLDDSLANLGTAEKAAVLNTIFGKIPIAGVNVLLQSGADRLREYRSQLEGADGAAANMAKTMRDTVQGRLNSLNSAIEGVTISIFSMNQGPLADTIDVMIEWVRANEKLIATNVGEFIASIVENMDKIIVTGKQIAGITVLYLAFSVAVKAAGISMILFNFIMTVARSRIFLFAASIVLIPVLLVALAAAIGVMTTAQLLWNLAMSLSPLGLFILAIGVLIGLGALVVLAWDPVKEFFSDLAVRIGAVVDTIGASASKFGSFFGFTDDEDDDLSDEQKAQAADIEGSAGSAANAAKVITPAERTARMIEETRQTSTSEVTIKDETGRAEVTKGKLGPGLKLQQSGAF